MANISILPQKDYGEIIGRGLGEAANTGLSAGLQTLANQKLERMQRKAAQHDLLSAFPDIPKEAAAYISTLPAKEQMQILEMLGNQRRQQEEQAMTQQQPQQQPGGLQQLQGPAQQQSQISTEPEEEMVQDAQYAQDLEAALQRPDLVNQLSPEQIQEATSQLEQIKQKLSSNPVGVNPFPKDQAQPVQQPAARPNGGIPLTVFNKASKDTIAREKQDLAREKFEFEKQESKEKSTQIAEKPKSAAQIKQDEALVADANQLADFISTTKRMNQTLDSEKVSPGIIPQGLSKLAPTLLSAENELFDKDASHILNLASSQQKGQQSKYRLQTLEKEKPGLGHSIKVNKEIVNRINKEAEHKLKALIKRHPNIEYSDEIIESLLPDPSEYSDDAVIKEKISGKSFSKDENGSWQIV